MGTYASPHFGLCLGEDVAEGNYSIFAVSPGTEASAGAAPKTNSGAHLLRLMPAIGVRTEMVYLRR